MRIYLSFFFGKSIFNPPPFQKIVKEKRGKKGILFENHIERRYLALLVAKDYLCGCHIEREGAENI